MKLRQFPVLFAAAILAATVAFVVSGGTARADEAWTTDFKAAQEKAKAEKKYLLVDFTGSDWCVWCKRLRGEVFDKEPFKTDAPKQYVLVELDFPNAKPQPDELKKQNKDLSEKYKIEGFPTVLMLDAEGQVIARTGYEEGGPENYLKKLAEFSKLYPETVALQGKLEGTKGLDRAKLLDQLIEDYQKLGTHEDEATNWSKEIIALDADNQAGLKVKYEFPLKVEEAQKAAQSGDFAKGKQLLDAALGTQGVPAEMRQEGYMVKAQLCEQQQKFIEMLAALKQAKEAAPDSKNVKQIDAMVAQRSKLAEAEEAFAKLEADLPKTQGVERAKLLDQVVEARQKYPAGPEAMKEIEQRSKEIIELDAENKAGLKTKHQFRLALSDAMHLAQTGKMDDADAALDKALAMPGISADDKQQGLFLKAQFALAHGKTAEGVDYMKKSLDAAPNSKLAPMIKQAIEKTNR